MGNPTEEAQAEAQAEASTDESASEKEGTDWVKMVCLLAVDPKTSRQEAWIQSTDGVAANAQFPDQDVINAHLAWAAGGMLQGMTDRTLGRCRFGVNVGNSQKSAIRHPMAVST